MQFGTTQWTVIRKAPDDTDALVAVIEQYQRPVHAFVEKLMHGDDDAEDVAQNFLKDKLLSKKLLEHADRARGSFRRLLKSALRNFVVDYYRASSMRPEPEVGRRVVVQPSALDLAEAAFDEALLRELIDRAVRTVEEDCLAHGMDRQWRAFEGRLLQSIRSGCEGRDIAALVLELQARDSQEISSMVDTVRKKVLRALLQLAAEIVENRDEAARELDDLLASVASARRPA